MAMNSLKAAAGATATVMVLTAAAIASVRILKGPRDLDQVQSLDTWRAPNVLKDEDVHWANLSQTLRGLGYHLWTKADWGWLQQSTDGAMVAPNGYLLVTSMRGREGPVGTIDALREVLLFNGLSRAARSPEGFDVMLRVMAIGDDGREQLRIWRGLATAPSVLLANNHTLPLLREIDIGRFTLGVFPLVSQNLEQVYSSWAQSSVGDILDMILQALEGLAYIHSQGIAHRDAFKNNFLVQFFPESLKDGVVSISKPRVYLIDFEVAVHFTDDCPASERVCTGIPCTGSLSNVSEYARPGIPEMLTGEPYDPFKLDVWQLASSFGEFDSTFEPVETLLDNMASDDPAGRLTADEAMGRLRAFVESVPPKALLIPPVIHKFK